MINSQLYFGIVEDRNDPLKLGRCRVRIAGLHTHDMAILPTEDLPWATVLSPISNEDTTLVAPREGTEVAVQFLDYPINQFPVVIGKVPTIPQKQSVFVDNIPTHPEFKDELTPAGRKLPTNATEADGGIAASVPVASDTPNQVATATEQGYNTAEGNKLKIVDLTATQSALTLGGTGAYTQRSMSLGGMIPTKSDTLEKLKLEYGNVEDAAKGYIAEIGKNLKSSLPSDLFDGKKSLSEVLGELNASLSELSLSDIMPKDVTDAIDTLNFESVSDYVLELGGETLDGLKKEALEVYDNAVTVANNTIVSLEQSFDSTLNSLSSLADNLLSGVGDIVGLGVSALQNPEQVVSAIGKGFTASAMSEKNIGNINKIAELGVKALNSTNFAEVGEGLTPPINGAFGGPNYGGAEPVAEKPSAFSTEDYPQGATRDLNTTLPNWFSGDAAKAEALIKYAVANFGSWGITTIEAQASFLACVGAASNFEIQTESANYTLDELIKYYPKTFGADRSLAKKYVNFADKGGSEEKFFSLVYDPATDGQSLGNDDPEDGYRYRRCGYLSIVGKSAYTKYGTLLSPSFKNILSGADAIKDSMEACLNVSALAFMYRLRLVPPTAHPQFFYAAVKAFGSTERNFDARLAERYYAHFYGAQTQALYSTQDRTAGSTVVPNSYYGSMQENPQGGSTGVGYQDPNNKYPYQRERNESSIPRLAKGDIRDTIVTLKEQQRTLGVPVALNGGTWNQPHSSYGARYPYNSVKQTESGHVIEVDDTPGKERIHTYHRSGTFEEIDQSGTKVTRIVGDGYTIVDRNGFISIDGNADVTVAGNVNVYCRSDANIQVEGSANMQVGGSMNLGVAKDFNLAVQGNLSMWANGSFNLQSATHGHILAKQNLYVAGTEELHLESDQRVFALSKQAMDIVSYESFKLRNDGTTDVHLLGQASIQVDSDLLGQYNANVRENIKGDHHVLVEGSVLNTANGNYDLRVEGSRKDRVGSSHDLFVSGALTTEAGGAFGLKSRAGLNLQSTSALNVNSASALNLQSGASTSILAGGNVGIDGTAVNLNSGTAGSAGSAASASQAQKAGSVDGAQNAEDAVKALIHGMIPPVIGNPLYPRIDPIEIPEPVGEEEFSVETPEEAQSSLATASMEYSTSIDGATNTLEGGYCAVTPNGLTGAEPENIAEILSCGKFTADYKVSEHFTLGMFFDGGFNVRHKLVPQAGLSVNEIVANISRLANNVLEPYLSVLPNGIDGYGKQWRITSGFRMNVSAPANRGSDHWRGRAVDIQLTGRNKRQHWELVQKLEPLVPYDQLLLEYRGRNSVWIHTGFRENGCRHQAFTMVNDRKYRDGFVLLA